MDERDDNRDAEESESGRRRELTEAEKRAIEGMGDRELRRFIAELQGRSSPLSRQLEDD